MKRKINDMPEELKQFKDEIIKMVKEENRETRRHFDVLAEDFDHKFKLLAEQIGANTEKLIEHDQRFDKIDQRLETLEIKVVNVEDKVEDLGNKVDGLVKDTQIIKTDIGFIKSELSQKVSREEFTFLERRVGILENKFSQAK